MINEEYLTFQRYNTIILAQELTDILKKNNIDCLLEDTSLGFDATFANNEFTKEYRVKIKKENFEIADQIVLKISQKQLETVQSDYYLFDFSDQELIEIVTKPDEWSSFDYVLAQKLLKDRGKEINPQLADTLKKNRINELGKAEQSQRNWILFGYALAFFGGLLGIFIGWHLRSHKKTLPNGDRVYAYLPEDRKSGSNIFIIGIFFFIFWTVFKIWISY
jgi:hypothetical protein